MVNVVLGALRGLAAVLVLVFIAWLVMHQIVRRHRVPSNQVMVIYGIRNLAKIGSFISAGPRLWLKEARSPLRRRPPRAPAGDRGHLPGARLHSGREMTRLGEQSPRGVKETACLAVPGTLLIVQR